MSVRCSTRCVAAVGVYAFDVICLPARNISSSLFTQTYRIIAPLSYHYDHVATRFTRPSFVATPPIIANTPPFTNTMHHTTLVNTSHIYVIFVILYVNIYALFYVIRRHTTTSYADKHALRAGVCYAPPSSYTSSKHATRHIERTNRRRHHEFTFIRHAAATCRGTVIATRYAIREYRALKYTPRGYLPYRRLRSPDMRRHAAPT